MIFLASHHKMGSLSRTISVSHTFFRMLIPRRVLPRRMLSRRVIPKRVLHKRVLPKQVLPKRVLPRQALPKWVPPKQTIRGGRTLNRSRRPQRLWASCPGCMMRPLPHQTPRHRTPTQLLGLLAAAVSHQRLFVHRKLLLVTLPQLAQVMLHLPR